MLLFRKTAIFCLQGHISDLLDADKSCTFYAFPRSTKNVTSLLLAMNHMWSSVVGKSKLEPQKYVSSEKKHFFYSCEMFFSIIRFSTARMCSRNFVSIKKIETWMKLSADNLQIPFVYQ